MALCRSPWVGHRARLHQSIAIFVIKLGRQAIKLGAPVFENLKRRCRRTWHFIGFAGVAFIQISQISAIRRSRRLASSAIFRRPITRLAPAAAQNFEPSSATSRAANRP